MIKNAMKFNSGELPVNSTLHWVGRDFPFPWGGGREEQMRITSWSQDRQGYQGRTTRNDQLCLRQERNWMWPARRQVKELQVTEVLKADFNEELDVAALVTWNGLDRTNHSWLVQSFFQCRFSRSRQEDGGIISDTAHSWRSAPLKMPCVRSTLCRYFQMILN